MRILFFTQTDIDGPASRYRAYQYLKYLNDHGIKTEILPAIKKGSYIKIYSGNNLLKKVIFFVCVFIKRLFDVFKVRQYDVIFIQREIIPQTFPIIETIIKMLNKKIIFDFDDAIFLVPPERNNFIYRFRYKKNIQKIIQLSKGIVAGNKYLKEYAQRFNNNVCLIPTSVDTGKFFPEKAKRNLTDEVVIGWIGTEHSIMYLMSISNALIKLNSKFNIILHVISSKDVFIEGVNVVNKAWNIDKEVEYLHKFDIGVAPLLDDEWGKGKCGLKALQYLSCEIATVCSNAGVYKEIISDGVNGFLASNEEEWIEKITLLIENDSLRKELGAKGRETVLNEYSLETNSIRLSEVFKNVISDK